MGEGQVEGLVLGTLPTIHKPLPYTPTPLFCTRARALRWWIVGVPPAAHYGLPL